METSKNSYIILIILSFFSCKKDNVENSVKKSIAKTTQSFYEFKEIGDKKLKNKDFPKEWKINTYDDKNIILSKEDIYAQKKFENLDYFQTLQSGKNMNFSKKFENYINNDSLLKLSKIDSLFVLDSIIINKNEKILYIKTIATFDDEKSELPIGISRLDIVLFASNKTKSIKLYSEVDFPYLTKQTMCYLEKSGEISCSNFTVDETKVYFNGYKKLNAKKIFNLK